ncbi:MAG: hypothetical protein WCP22_03310 [Chlamydiota bacterium]
MRWLMTVALVVLAGTAGANSTVFYSGEVNNFGIQILNASLQPDNARTGDDEHLHVALVGQRRDGSGGAHLTWTTALAKVASDTEGNYAVSVTVPSGADEIYGSVTVTLRLDDTGWGVSREWNLAPARWMTAAQFTPAPSAKVVAGAVGSTLSSAHGAGPWGQAVAGSNVVNVKCQSADATPLPIVSAQVQCRDSSSGALLYYATTSVSGIATMNLDPGSYKFYAYKLGSYIFSNPQTLTVDEDPENVTVTGTIFSPSMPPAPDICVVYGWAYDAHGNLQPIATVKVTFSSNYGTYGNNQIVKKTWTGTANSSAYWEVPCVPNSLIYPDDTSYTFEIGTFKYAGIVVPDLSSIAFDQALNPATPTPTPTATATPAPTATP